MIIALVNSKGGVGKSTIAGNLVAWLHLHGHKVILVDCDTQKSSSEWISEAFPTIRIVRLETAEDVLEELPQLQSEAEYIVCDGPGSQTETSVRLLQATCSYSEPSSKTAPQGFLRDQPRSQSIPFESYTKH